MRQIIIALFLLTLSIYANSQTRTFSNNNQYSIISNEGWNIVKTKGGITISQPLVNRLDQYQENIIFNEYPANGKTLDYLWNLYVINDFPNQFENYKFIQAWNSNINEKKANWMEYTNTSNGILFKVRVYMLVENDKMYYIICTAKEQDYENVKDDFIKMVNTIEIK